MNEAPKRSIAGLARNALKLMLICIAAIYLIICVLITIFQRSLMYFPSVATPQQVESAAHSAGLERWTNAAGQIIGMKRLSPVQPTAGSVLISYGNGSTAVGSSRYADDVQRVSAFDVYILEYPGYQDRPGRPSQRTLFEAADGAMQALPASKPIYLIGESLGSGVASYLAGTYSNKISGLLLISPFNTMVDAAQSHYPILPVGLLIADRYPSEKYLRDYHGRVGITLGGRDPVVLPKLTRRLFNNYAGPKKLWEIPDGDHCQLPADDAIFWKQVAEFWGVPENQ